MSYTLIDKQSAYNRPKTAKETIFKKARKKQTICRLFYYLCSIEPGPERRKLVLNNSKLNDGQKPDKPGTTTKTKIE